MPAKPFDVIELQIGRANQCTRIDCGAKLEVINTLAEADSNGRALFSSAIKLVPAGPAVDVTVDRFRRVASASHGTQFAAIDSLAVNSTGYDTLPPRPNEQTGHRPDLWPENFPIIAKGSQERGQREN